MRSYQHDRKRYALPNHRCPECVMLRKKMDTWATSSCRECSFFPKYFNGFLLLEMGMKLRLLGKDYLTLHKEVQHIFEGLVSLDRRIGRLEHPIEAARAVSDSSDCEGFSKKD